MATPSIFWPACVPNKTRQPCQDAFSDCQIIFVSAWAWTRECFARGCKESAGRYTPFIPRNDAAATNLPCRGVFGLLRPRSENPKASVRMRGQFQIVRRIRSVRIGNEFRCHVVCGATFFGVVQ